jgi:CheY-like chemotaxis protein
VVGVVVDAVSEVLDIPMDDIEPPPASAPASGATSSPAWARCASASSSCSTPNRRWPGRTTGSARAAEAAARPAEALPPEEDTAVTAIPRRQTGPAPGGYRSVLVVDDSPVQRAHAVGLCRDLGIELIYEACNGLEALELLALLVLPPSLLLVDLEMPGMDGIEFIEQLHRRSVGFPVLIVSSREQMLLTRCARWAWSWACPWWPRCASAADAGALCETLKAPAGALHGATVSPVSVPATWTRPLRQRPLQVHYQPKVDIRSGLLRGVEALARWTHPALGPIPPDQFIRWPSARA